MSNRIPLIGQQRPNIPAAPVFVLGQAKAFTIQMTDGTLRAQLAGTLFAADVGSRGVRAEDDLRAAALDAMRAVDIFLDTFVAENKRSAEEQAAKEAAGGNAPTTTEPQ